MANHEARTNADLAAIVAEMLKVAKSNREIGNNMLAYNIERWVSALHSQAQEREGWVLDDEVRWILGRPNFACISIANTLRASGVKIQRRSEDEQATVLHWMLTMYAKHGDAWRDEAEKALDFMANVAVPTGGSET